MKLGFIKNNLRDYGLLLSLVVIMGFFQYQTDGVLMQPLNITNLVLQNSYIIVMALGMLLVIVAGYIDLSVGSVSGFIGGLAAVLIVQYSWPVVPTIIVALLVGALIGAAQGWFVAYARIPSFIVTLAGMLIFKGLALALLQGQSVGPFPLRFQRISTGFLPDPFGGTDFRVLSLIVGVILALGLVAAEVRKRRKAQAHDMDVEPVAFFVAKNVLFAGAVTYLVWLLSTYKGLPDVLILMAVLILIYQFVTNRTTIGRRDRCAGRQRKGGTSVGCEHRASVLSDLCKHGRTGGGGGSDFRRAPEHRNAEGRPRLRAGCDRGLLDRRRIGLRGRGQGGGRGHRCAFIMGVMNNGMSISGIGIDYQQVIKGMVLLAAVFLDVYNRNRG